VSTSYLSKKFFLSKKYLKIFFRDEELQASCITHIIQNMGLSIISNDQINVLFEVCQTIQEKGSWKAKITWRILFKKFSPKLSFSGFSDFYKSSFLQIFSFYGLKRELLIFWNPCFSSFWLIVVLKFVKQVRKLWVDWVGNYWINLFSIKINFKNFLVRAGIISVDEQLVKSAETLASSPKQSIQRHSGVLALASIVLAFPYSVPSFVPKILMQICYSAPTNSWHGHLLSILHKSLLIVFCMARDEYF